jgi:hypothetical protein
VDEDALRICNTSHFPFKVRIVLVKNKSTGLVYIYLKRSEGNAVVREG